jgi:hypothetical protein
MNARVLFPPEDSPLILPPPGFYPATITAARFRHSSRGNRMLHLALRLDGVPPAFQCIADYFVLEGASPLGLSVARRRLLELYHACALYPEQDDQLLPSHLVGLRVEVNVDHVQWQNHPRLRVLAYRAPWPTALQTATPSERRGEDGAHG